MDSPKFSLVFFMLEGSEFCYEAYQCLSFYGCPGAMFYIKLTELNSPLYHPSSDLGFIYCFLDGLVCHHYDRVSLEVRTKFSRGHY